MAALGQSLSPLLKKWLKPKEEPFPDSLKISIDHWLVTKNRLSDEELDKKYPINFPKPIIKPTLFKSSNRKTNDDLLDGLKNQLREGMDNES